MASSRDAAAAEKLTIGLTECVHTLANEPSLGLYYVCEHIQRAVHTNEHVGLLRATTTAVCYLHVPVRHVPW